MALHRASGTRSVWSVFSRFLLTVVLVSFSTTCGGDSGSGPDPVDNTVTSVSVSPSSGTIDAVGSTTTFTAVGRNAAGSTVAGTTFTWSSSSGTVAAVSDAGVVTGIGNGTATITATAVGTSASGSAQVTVQQVVASVSVSPQDGSIEIGEDLQLAATAEDSGGATVEGATFTWASSDLAVATVTSAGLVTGVSDGDVTITATSGGSNGTAPVTVIRNDLEITVDQNLEGDVTADDFTIPAGVTVTATDDLTIDATGEVQILGTITGDCVSLTVQGDTAVTVKGTLDNGCTAGGDGEPLSVTADGELTLEDATIISSGDMEFSNDPTLTDNDFPEPSASQVNGRASSGNGPQRAGSGIPFTVVNRTTVRYEGGETGPEDADDGANNDNGDGGNGKNGRRVRFRLRGNAEFNGGTTLWGQNAGDGGYGNKSAAEDIDVEGGDGGNGGDIRVWVTGTLTYAGSDNVVRSGNAGHGGNSSASALENADPSTAPSAKAEGGKGGEPGLIDIRAGGGVNVGVIINPSLTLELGAPGDGGVADASGADGVDATDTKPAQNGGNAEARGGEGGGTPSKQLVKVGNVTGEPPEVTGHDGAELVAGKGGDATAQGGWGGDGSKQNKDGGEGGGTKAYGGDGADYELKGLDGMVLGDGGDGGKATFMDGWGGDGWDDCEPGEPTEAGGAGGKGGDAEGEDGEGGTGKQPGTAGGIQTIFVANGGDGGREDGALGPAGQDKITANGARPADAFSFLDGEEADKCPPVGMQIQAKIAVTEVENQNGVIPTPLSQPLGISQVGGAIAGTIGMNFTGAAVGAFVGSNPDRLGLSGGNGNEIQIDVSSVAIAGYTAAVTAMELCFVNTGGVSQQNPIVVEQRDAQGTVIEETTNPDPIANSCSVLQLLPTAALVVIYMRNPGVLDVLAPLLFLLLIALG